MLPQLRMRAHSFAIKRCNNSLLLYLHDPTVTQLVPPSLHASHLGQPSRPPYPGQISIALLAIGYSNTNTLPTKPKKPVEP